jgi:tripartite-type tricarboxylate transporter receptor subunit TctC
MRKATKQPDMKERLIKVGVEPAMSSPEEFREFLRKESQRMEAVLKDAHID